MSKQLIFAQAHGRAEIKEVELDEAPTLNDVEKALTAAGIAIDTEAAIFVDDAEEPLGGDRHRPVAGLKHGARLHLSRCRRIKTTVNFLDKSAEREFPPGARVPAVKEWAVRTFKMNPKDAAEHVLQLCKSTKRPTPDTPLHELIEGRVCAVCFDLVPEKRVEG